MSNKFYPSPLDLGESITQLLKYKPQSSTTAIHFRVYFSTETIENFICPFGTSYTVLETQGAPNEAGPHALKSANDYVELCTFVKT